MSSNTKAAVISPEPTPPPDRNTSPANVYQYSGVPESVYKALMSAPSHGKYFAAYIRNNYSYRQIR